MMVLNGEEIFDEKTGRLQCTYSLTTLIRDYLVVQDVEYTQHAVTLIRANAIRMILNQLLGQDTLTDIRYLCYGVIAMLNDTKLNDAAKKIIYVLDHLSANTVFKVRQERKGDRENEFHTDIMAEVNRILKDLE